jgi:hypothetical protein
MAACTSDFAHEALGHGGACLISGAQITLLNNAFFECSRFERYVAASGPLCNLAVGLIAFIAQSMIPGRRPSLRLYALLVMSFSLFWEAGYLIQAVIRDSGDSVFAWRELVGPMTTRVQVFGIALGVASYLLFFRMLTIRAALFASVPGRVGRLFRPAWFTGIAVMALAASLYAPDRFGAMRDATLSTGASFPLLFTSPRPKSADSPVATIVRDGRVIALGVSVLIFFAATMGRGIH